MGSGGPERRRPAEAQGAGGGRGGCPGAQRLPATGSGGLPVTHGTCGSVPREARRRFCGPETYGGGGTPARPPQPPHRPRASGLCRPAGSGHSSGLREGRALPARCQPEVSPRPVLAWKELVAQLEGGGDSSGRAVTTSSEEWGWVDGTERGHGRGRPGPDPEGVGAGVAGRARGRRKVAPCRSGCARGGRPPCSPPRLDLTGGRGLRPCPGLSGT